MTFPRSILFILLTVSLAIGPASAADAKPKPIAQSSPKASKAKTPKKAKGKSRRKAKRSRRSSKVTYTVKAGDTLLRIANKFGVKTGQVQRWNRLKGDTVRVGKKLTIRPNRIPRTRHRVWHRVKKGETFTHIAKRYKVKTKELKAWNPKLNPRTLRPGKKVAIWKYGPKHRSRSSGSASGGRLVNGVMLTSGPGFRVRNGARAFGTHEAVTLIQQCISENSHSHRKAGKLMIGDVSHKGGGHMRPHVSHQSGRDADISYYIKGADTSGRFKAASPKTLNLRATWDLLHRFMETDRVEYIFVDYSLQRALYRHARKRGFKKSYLDKVFQYPRSRGKSVGTIRYSRGHDDHFHIRFKCGRKDKRCR
jgi:LysM repeat protein